MGTNQYRVCIVGCGRMGGTIDEEVRATPHGALPYSHAAGYTAFERTDLVAAADVVEEKAQYVCNKWDIPKYYLDYREMIVAEKRILLVSPRVRVTMPRLQRSLQKRCERHLLR